jgi:hypothetical protein
MKWMMSWMTFAWFAVGSAQEGADWRLELLQERGLSAETEVLEEFSKGLGHVEGDMVQLIEQLGSVTFKQREQAQKEILWRGKAVLPQLRQGLSSDDPEVRMRLTRIMAELEGGGRWAKEDLLREAVTSLLEERKQPAAMKPGGKLFVEFFNTDQASLENGYRRLKFQTGVGVGGRVSKGMVSLSGRHEGDGDQQLLLHARDLTGNAEFPDSFRVETKIGGSGEGVGAFHVGISIGNVRALFHPGYSGGAFRFEEVSENMSILGNTDMGFTPPPDKLLLMSVDVKRLPGNEVGISVNITHEKQTFRKSQTVKSEFIGKLDRISLDRSGRNGGDAWFDDLIVDLE